MTTVIPYILPVFQNPALTGNQISAFSIIVIGLLFCLLVEKEFIRAYALESIRSWVDTFNIFTWALLCLFIYIILMRFLGFIHN
jgi:hypothetical protein